MRNTIETPFPWFGGKTRAAHLVWQALGDVGNYIEPFAGSLASLLARPSFPKTETVNDLDGNLANFWRAVKYAPAEVSAAADWPISEIDLHARHAFLVRQTASLSERLLGDPRYYDAELAGWWYWGISCWMGSGWCSGKGPWRQENGQLVKGGSGPGIWKQRPDLGTSAAGVVYRRPSLGRGGRGCHSARNVDEHLAQLADRLRKVRICCGDWSRVLTPAVTTYHGITGVFLDPPYAVEAGREANLYAHDAAGVSEAVRAWALANGANPEFRIVLAGYDGEHDMPADWRVVEWEAVGGFANPASAIGPRKSLFSGVLGS